MTPTKPKVKARFTNTQGERIVSYTDGTKETLATPTLNAGTSPRLASPKVEPTISATALANPTPQINPPTPATPTIPSRTKQFVSNVARDTQGFITAQSEEAAKAKELAQAYGAMSNEGSLADLMRGERDKLGIDTNLSELKDIQLQLSDMDTSSEMTKVQIEGAAGQTVGQSQREVTQEDRENAVRTSGLAARAAVLQGNINTATQLAKDTVDLAFKDRQLKAENLLNQLNYFQGVSDKQTGQLLEEDKRQYEAELGRIEELKTNIANAMVNGASQAEIAQLNDPNIPDEQKLSMAQQITARGANQMRNLEIQKLQASIANDYDQISARREKATAEDLDENGLLKISKEEIQKVNDAAISRDAFKELIRKAEANIKDYGTFELMGTEAGEKNSLKTNLLFAMKNLEQTGALDKGTTDVLAETIPDNKFFATKDGQLGMLNTLSDAVVGKADAYIDSYRATSALTDPRTSRIYQQPTQLAPTASGIDQRLYSGTITTGGDGQLYEVVED